MEEDDSFHYWSRQGPVTFQTILCDSICNKLLTTFYKHSGVSLLWELLSYLQLFSLLYINRVFYAYLIMFSGHPIPSCTVLID